MLAKRFVTALLAVPIVLIILYGGIFALLGLILPIALLAFAELWRLLNKTPVAILFGVVYIGAPFAVMVMIYDFNHGPLLLIFTLLAVWAADTSAYATGRLFGRRPLAPSVSPNKTIEGAIGGVAVTALIFAALSFMPSLSMVQRIIFGSALAVAASLGDLFESWLKRRAGVKDSGTILPGHGGILDRIDSLLFVAPTSYLLLKIWI